MGPHKQFWKDSPLRLCPLYRGGCKAEFCLFFQIPVEQTMIYNRSNVRDEPPFFDSKQPTVNKKPVNNI